MNEDADEVKYVDEDAMRKEMTQEIMFEGEKDLCHARELKR